MIFHHGNAVEDTIYDYHCNGHMKTTLLCNCNLSHAVGGAALDPRIDDTAIVDAGARPLNVFLVGIAARSNVVSRVISDQVPASIARVPEREGILPEGGIAWVRAMVVVPVHGGLPLGVTGAFAGELEVEVGCASAIIGVKAQLANPFGHPEVCRSEGGKAGDNEVGETHFEFVS